jgi:DNA-binding IclR family transcriptional regulator
VRQIDRSGPALEDSLLAVLAAVEAGESSPDGVAAALGLSGSEAAVALSRLELLGYLACSQMGVYSRTLLPASSAVDI